MGRRGKGQQRRQAHRGRSALHALGRGFGPLCTDPAGHGHRVPVGRDALPAGHRQDPSEVRQCLHQRLLHREGRLQVRGRTVHGLRRGPQELRRSHDVGVRVRRAGHGQGRRDPAEPALRHQPPEGPCRALHARDGRADLRHAEGQVPEGLRADRLDGQRRAFDDLALCAGLDAAHDRRTEHPQHGHDPAPAGQHGHPGWWRERAARSLQRPGHHRLRAAHHLDAGLSCPAERAGGDLRRLHEVARLQADPSRPDQLLAELREVLRQPAEEPVRQGGDQGERLGLRLPAQVRHGLRRSQDRRHDGGRPDERPVLPGPERHDGRAQQGQGPGRSVQAQVARDHGSAGDRDGAVLGKPRRVQQRRSQVDPDRGVPASDHGLCRGRGHLHQLQPRHPVALEVGGRAGRIAR